jgi:hypothetical protein
MPLKVYEDKLYKCQKCGADKVRKRVSSPYIPKYCPDCLKEVKREITKAAQAGLQKKKLSILNKSSEAISIKGPDGYPVYFINNDEKEYYIERWNSYKTDYDWTNSSDNGLLAKLLSLELEIYRLQQSLYISQKPRLLDTLRRLSEEYRRCQQDLGINRLQRITAKEEESASSLLTELFAKFRKYQQEHADQFKWQCQYCGKINLLNKINYNSISEESKTEAEVTQ